MLRQLRSTPRMLRMRLMHTVTCLLLKLQGLVGRSHSFCLMSLLAHSVCLTRAVSCPLSHIVALRLTHCVFCSLIDLLTAGVPHYCCLQAAATAFAATRLADERQNRETERERLTWTFWFDLSLKTDGQTNTWHSGKDTILTVCHGQTNTCHSNGQIEIGATGKRRQVLSGPEYLAEGEPT